MDKSPLDGSIGDITPDPGNDQAERRHRMAQIGVPKPVLTTVDAARTANERAQAVIEWCRTLRRAEAVRER